MTLLRRRLVLAAALVLGVVAVALLFVSQGPAAATTAALDPDNPTPNGSQALARVLEQQGVRVDVARSESELARAGADSDTTVFVARTTELTQSTTEHLVDLAQEAERLVVVAPGRAVVSVMAPDVRVTEARRPERDLVASGCSGPDVRPGETLSRSQAEYQASGPSAGEAATCFTNDGHSVYLSLPHSGGAPALVLFGSSTALSNDQITQASNAAVALRILGHSARVVWYVPSLQDAPAGDDAPAALVPRWVGPALALLVVGFVATAFWKGRRLGRLVPEPLPAVVRAVETTESRGRLYRRSKDAARAGSVLQQASRARLADYLGMPRSASSDPGAAHALVVSVATVTGRLESEVGALLFGPPPSDDDQLLGVSVELANLEKEVRRQ